MTTSDTVYACGDVIGKYLFTQAASFYAKIAVNNIVRKEKLNISGSVMPWVVFTDPELAHVGFTEDEAREKFGEVNILRVDTVFGRLRTDNSTRVYLKIILTGDDMIVGAHALGTGSGEYIQNLTMAMQDHITVNLLWTIVVLFLLRFVRQCRRWVDGQSVRRASAVRIGAEVFVLVWLQTTAGLLSLTVVDWMRAPPSGSVIEGAGAIATFGLIIATVSTLGTLLNIWYYRWMLRRIRDWIARDDLRRRIAADVLEHQRRLVRRIFRR